jgi:hypothetical protein
MFAIGTGFDVIVIPACVVIPLTGQVVDQSVKRVTEQLSVSSASLWLPLLGDHDGPANERKTQGRVKIVAQSKSESCSPDV